MIEGKHLNLRLVEESDAEFILNLRIDDSLGKFLSKTDVNLEKQKEWIKNYKFREKIKGEFYFIIQDKQGNSYGTIRIYNINKQSEEFEWGSWILLANRPEKFSYFSIIESFAFAFNKLSLKKALINVRIENKKAHHIYIKIGCQEIKRDKKDIYLEYTKENFEKFKKCFEI